MAKTVLTVDDSASIRQMVMFTLKSAGYEVVEAVDGEDGLNKAKMRGADLVLTDQNMPKMDGLTFLQKIMSHGVMSTPGVVIDGKVVHAGGVPARSKVEGWFA